MLKSASLQPIPAYSIQSIDYVITACDRTKESFPCWPQTGSLIHWSFDDPAVTIGTPEKRRYAFRTVQDQVKVHLKEFLPTPFSVV